MLRNRTKSTRGGFSGPTRWAVALILLGAPAVYAEPFFQEGSDRCSHGGTQVFRLAADGGDLIGDIQYVTARQQDSLHDIACRYNIGVEEIFMANDPANIDHWSPGEGTRVLVPQRFILPGAPRAGIVVNIPEMRLYFYPVKYATIVKKSAPKAKSGKGKSGAKAKAVPPRAPESVTEVGEPISKAVEVITYPISMGRMDWRTPVGKTRIAQKVKDPTWTPPESIRREHAAKGDILPAVVPAGPDNPLGAFAMKLGVPGYLIHGTEQNYKSFGIGMRVTHGCMRMYNEDVARLFPLVSVGTPVYLVNQPVKLGWQGGRLYMELSQPLDEDVGIPPEKDEEDMTQAELAREEAKTPEQRAAERKGKNARRSAYLEKLAMNLIQKENAKRPILLDREALRQAIEQPTGLPVEIGKEAVPLEAAPGQYAPDQDVPGQYPSDQYSPQPAVPGPYAAPRQPPYGDSPSQQPAAGQYGGGQYAPPPAPSAPYPQYPYDPYGSEQAAPSAPYPQDQYGGGRTGPSSQYPQGVYGSGRAAPPEPYGAPQTAPERSAPGRYEQDPWAPPGQYAPEQTSPEPYVPDQSAPVSDTPDPYAPDAEAPSDQFEGGR
jgi:L,D-transpeptidase ErfK/SrfK